MVAPTLCLVVLSSTRPGSHPWVPGLIEVVGIDKNISVPQVIRPGGKGNKGSNASERQQRQSLQKHHFHSYSLIQVTCLSWTLQKPNLAPYIHHHLSPS